MFYIVCYSEDWGKQQSLWDLIPLSYLYVVTSIIIISFWGVSCFLLLFLCLLIMKYQASMPLTPPPALAPFHFKKWSRSSKSWICHWNRLQVYSIAFQSAIFAIGQAQTGFHLLLPEHQIRKSKRGRVKGWSFNVRTCRQYMLK